MGCRFIYGRIGCLQMLWACRNAFCNGSFVFVYGKLSVLGRLAVYMFWMLCKNV